MKKKGVTILAVACLASVLAFTGAQAFMLITRDMAEKEVLTEIDLIQIADNFIILFDASSSTNAMVPGRDRSVIEATKSLLQERNQWLPDLGYQAGLYIYTDHALMMGRLKPVVDMGPYHRETMAAGIAALPEKGQGPTMLQAGLHALRDVVGALSGRTAVILFTDGGYTHHAGTKRPLQIAQEIAKDNDVCFYLISSATEAENAKLLTAVSKVNACSRVIPLTAFMDNPHYLSGALFTVKTTSYERLRPTPVQTTQAVVMVIEDVLFDFNDASIRSEYGARLDLLGDFLQKNPDAFVVAGGYTDSIGDEEYNLALSQRRAAGVKDYLVNNLGVDADRIVTLWFGELNPIADNATDKGRQLNRRVEIAVGVME